MWERDRKEKGRKEGEKERRGKGERERQTGREMQL